MSEDGTETLELTADEKRALVALERPKTNWFIIQLCWVSLIILLLCLQICSVMYPPPTHVWMSIGYIIIVIYSSILIITKSIAIADNLYNNLYLITNIFGIASYIIVTIVAFANIFRAKGLLTDGNVPVHNVSDFLYFSIVTWTTTGYGDIKPAPDARMYAAAEALLGYVSMGLFLAFVFYLISSRDRRR